MPTKLKVIKIIPKIQSLALCEFSFRSTYEKHPKSEKGDLIVGINTCIEVLKNQSASKEDKVFHLKMLIHFMGDLHQPLHVGMADDRGGNDLEVKWFNNGTNLTCCLGFKND